MTTSSQNSFNLEKHESNHKNIITFTKTYNPNHQFFFSAHLKTALRTLQIEDFKKHLMTKNTPHITTAEEIKKYASISKI